MSASYTLTKLRLQGFNESYNIPFTRTYKVKCSQCEALCINGMATHETGCPNQTHECKGCGASVQSRGYCQDCL